MKLKIDENLPQSLTTIFQSAGHDAVSVIDQDLSGEPDRRIVGVCQSEARALVTLDVGFADIRAYPPAEHPGILVLRLRRQDVTHLKAAVERILGLLPERPVAQSLWIVEEHRVRFRS